MLKYLLKSNFRWNKSVWSVCRYKMILLNWAPHCIMCHLWQLWRISVKVRNSSYIHQRGKQAFLCQLAISQAFGMLAVLHHNNIHTLFVPLCEAGKLPFITGKIMTLLRKPYCFQNSLELSGLLFLLCQIILADSYSKYFHNMIFNIKCSCSTTYACYVIRGGGRSWFICAYAKK